MKKNINCKLEVIRGSHGNPLLLVKFKTAKNFIKINTEEIEELTWVPTLDEIRLISDTLYLLNDMVEYIKKTGKKSIDYEIGHD